MSDFETHPRGTEKELARLRAIETAATKLRDDMIMRADIGTYEGDHSVQAGNSVWYKLCVALDPTEALANRSKPNPDTRMGGKAGVDYPAADGITDDTEYWQKETDKG